MAIALDTFSRVVKTRARVVLQSCRKRSFEACTT